MFYQFHRHQCGCMEVKMTHISNKLLDVKTTIKTSKLKADDLLFASAFRYIEYVFLKTIFRDIYGSVWKVI